MLCVSPARYTPAMPDDLVFLVVKPDSEPRVIVKAMNLLIARAAYDKAVAMYPGERIHLKHGARVIETNEEGGVAR